jgi:hypothetical protein
MTRPAWKPTEEEFEELMKKNNRNTTSGERGGKEKDPEDETRVAIQEVIDRRNKPKEQRDELEEQRKEITDLKRKRDDRAISESLKNELIGLRKEEYDVAHPTQKYIKDKVGAGYKLIVRGIQDHDANRRASIYKHTASGNAKRFVGETRSQDREFNKFGGSYVSAIGKNDRVGVDSWAGGLMGFGNKKSLRPQHQKSFAQVLSGNIGRKKHRNPNRGIKNFNKIISGF